MYVVETLMQLIPAKSSPLNVYCFHSSGPLNNHTEISAFSYGALAELTGKLKKHINASFSWLQRLIMNRQLGQRKAPSLSAEGMQLRLCIQFEGLCLMFGVFCPVTFLLCSSCVEEKPSRQ